MLDNYRKLERQYSSKPDGYYEQARPEMLHFVPNSCTRILEIGCGAGSFGALIKKDRPNAIVWGIEPQLDAASLARDVLDRVITGSMDKGIPELEGERFDCIVFNDVLEHLINPEEMLVTSKDYLNPNGFVVTSIPNILYFPTIYSILRNQDWKYEPLGVMDRTHLRFFTRISIVRLFETCGYRIEEIQGINGFSHWKFNLLNILLRHRINDSRYVQFAVTARAA